MEQQNQQPIQKTENKSPIKTNWKYIAIVVVFGLTAVGGILMLKTMQPAPVEPPSVVQQTLPPFPQSQPLDTANWQTYRNEEFGFEVRYPPSYDQNEFCRPSSEAERARILIGPITFYKIDMKGMTFVEYVDKVVREEEEYYRERFKQKLPGGYIESKTPIILGEREAMRIISHACGAGCYNPHVIYVQNGSDILKIIYDDGIMNHCPFNSYELPSEVADQILSTFRFVERTHLAE
ncbi:MAG: hypothetical protein AAB567_03030 [Patescibacteria group bacterium]